VVAGLVIGGLEAVSAVAFGALVFIGRLDYFAGDGIGLFLIGAAVTLAVMAWLAGTRGAVGGLQAAGVAVISVVAAAAGVKARGSPSEGFLAVVAAIMVVTIGCGVLFLVLARRRSGNVIRYLPVPVVGGFMAGAGWLLFDGGLHLAVGDSPFYTDLVELAEPRALRLWLPTLAFGLLAFVVMRVVRRPGALAAVIGIGLAAFVGVALVAGLDEVRRGGWLLGPFEAEFLWQPWTARALGGADWLAVVESWAQIVTAILVIAVVFPFQVMSAEVATGRPLEPDRELRDAGVATLAAGVLGGMPGFHALGVTSLAARMGVDARRVGLIAAAVPLAVVVFGIEVVELFPRAIAGGVLVALGLSLIAEWVWDRRRVLPRLEYGVVVTILVVIVARGFLAGIVVGIVLSVVLFAVSYGRVDLVHEVAFGEVYRSNVDRSPADRERVRHAADRVRIWRVGGYVFFGSANRLLERIRSALEADPPPRFLVIDLQRVTGLDASAVAALTKTQRLAAGHGSHIVVTGASDTVRARLERGGVLAGAGAVSIEPDLDRGLERCEEELLAAAGGTAGADDAPGAPPPRLEPFLERVEMSRGTVLLRQGDPPGDVLILEDGRLAVEMTTPEGTRVRLRSLRPGVVVGEIALYADRPRTADVVAETDGVVLRLPRDAIARMDDDDPEAAAELHRWLAGTLAGRLTDTMRTLDALLD
jgi:SulP family sulfate permease